MLCGLHTGVFFLVLPRDIDTISPIIPIVAVWLLGGVVDDAPADEVNIGGLFIGNFIPHFIGTVADLPYPVFVLFPLIGGMLDLWRMQIFQRPLQQHRLCGLFIPRRRKFFQLGVQFLFQRNAGLLALCDFRARQRDQRGDMRAGPPIVE